MTDTVVKVKLVGIVAGKVIFTFESHDNAWSWALLSVAPARVEWSKK